MPDKKKHIINRAIVNVVNYFEYFKYAPTRGEIYRFLPVKTTEKELQAALENLIKKRKLLTGLYNKVKLYTLSPHSIDIQTYTTRNLIARKKLRKIRSYISLLSQISSIKLIGLSGSIAMNYAVHSDDIDIFIISVRSRLWTARLIANITAFMFGLKRKRGVVMDADKVCLNLFFDESQLAVPQSKQNLYVGHEILQMRPLVSKDGVYERFLAANEWVYDFFPNAKKLKFSKDNLARYTKLKTQNSKQTQNTKHQILNVLGDILEKAARAVQLAFINRHCTSEIIGDCQLWFFPDDFEKRLRSEKVI